MVHFQDADDKSALGVEFDALESEMDRISIVLLGVVKRFRWLFSTGTKSLSS